CRALQQRGGNGFAVLPHAGEFGGGRAAVRADKDVIAHDLPVKLRTSISKARIIRVSLSDSVDFHLDSLDLSRVKPVSFQWFSLSSGSEKATTRPLRSVRFRAAMRPR